MKEIHWDPVKNEKLKTERSVSFDEITACIKNKKILAIIQNPSPKYQDQFVFVVELNRYIYYVPFIRIGEDIFLKTIIPSRKLTKRYLPDGGDPMRNYKFDPEEQELLDSIERGEWKPTKNMKEQLRTYAEYAYRTLKKDQRISIRMSKQDVVALKTKAADEGLPYQTLITSLLHKYVLGRLVPKH